MSHVLHRDYETRSNSRLDLSGPWRYASDPATEVLCVGFAVDDGPARVWTPGQPVPPEFVECASNPDWLAAAHNDMFETAIETHVLSRHGFPSIPIARHR